MADTYTGNLNVVEEIPDKGAPFEIILAGGLTVVAGIIYFAMMK